MAEAVTIVKALTSIVTIWPELLEVKDTVVNFREDVEQLESALVIFQDAVASYGGEALIMDDHSQQEEELERRMGMDDSKHRELKKLIEKLQKGEDLQKELERKMGMDDRKRRELKKLIEKLHEGEELFQKCCKVPSWNIYLKIRYSGKIAKLDGAILRFCQRELQVQRWHDNHQIMRDIQQRVIKVEEATSQQQGRTLDVGSLGYKGLFAVPELPVPVVGFDIHLSELKFKLFQENVKVLGLCAPGGCGKSTLAAMLCRDEQVGGATGRYKDNIYFVTVSKTPNTLEILNRLLQEISNEKPESSLSEEDAAKQFRYLLEQRKSRPLLLVLDDVWDETIIENFFSKEEGYKMLVTSREVFKRYNSQYHSNYLLKTLGPEDSMTLFRQTARSQDGNEDYEPDEDLLNEMVKFCGGFPLAITVIANSPAVIWKKIRDSKRLKSGSSICNVDDELWKRLATSLDSLDDIVLQCFLDLVSFPEYKRIPAAVLFDIWCELNELDDEDDAYINLLELASRNLVNLVGNRKIAKENEASFNELFVTQHDILRELANYQSQPKDKRHIIDTREKALPKSRRGQENCYLNARLVSLWTGEMCSESWYDLQLPEVEVLMLNFSASNYALPPFMEKMKKLEGSYRGK